jgi:hypothetical protein
MQQSPSSEPNTSSAGQATFSIQWNLKVHYSVHNSPSPVPNQSNLIHFPNSMSLRSILILSSHLRRGLPSGLFHSGLSTKTLHAPLLSPIRAACSAHLLNLMTRICGEYFRCRTAGEKPVFGRSCNRPPRYRFSWFPCVF